MAKAFEPRTIETTQLCPRCAMREATVEATGFCEACTDEHRVERYLEDQAVEIAARRKAWRRWDTERQRHSRLLRATRPAERLPAETDPPVFAYELLKLLTHTRGPAGVVERVREGIKQLAAGPEA